MNYWVNGVEEYDGSGDLGRIVREHEFLRILASAVAARGLGNPIEDNDLLGEIAPDLTLDSTFTLRDMVDLVLDFHSINPDKAPETTLPNIEDYTDYMYEGYDYGSVVLPSYPQDQQTIDNWLGIKSPPASTVSPSSITVRVLDGAGNPAAAAKTTAKLRTSDTGSWAGVPGPPWFRSRDRGRVLPGSSGRRGTGHASLSGIVSMTEAPVGHLRGATSRRARGQTSPSSRGRTSRSSRRPPPARVAQVRGRGPRPLERRTRPRSRPVRARLTACRSRELRCSAAAFLRPEGMP